MLTRLTGPMIRPRTGNTNGGAPSGLSKTFGGVAANLTGQSFNGTTSENDSRGARNRGANAGGMTSLYQDFPFAQIQRSIERRVQLRAKLYQTRVVRPDSEQDL